MGLEEKGWIYLRRRLVFSAAHRMCHSELGDGYYGKCEQLHGHNYTVEITVRGKVDPVSGYAMDLAKLKEIMHENITVPLDHKNLDTDVPWFKDKVQTSENLAVYIWEQLHGKISDGAELYSVRLHETENNMVEYFG